MRLTCLPGRNCLQPIENRPIVTSSHLNAESGRDEAKVEHSKVGLLVPWYRVTVEEPNDLGLLCKLLRLESRHGAAVNEASSQGRRWVDRCGSERRYAAHALICQSMRPLVGCMTGALFASLGGLSRNKPDVWGSLMYGEACRPLMSPHH